MKRTWWQAGGLLLTVALTIVLAGISNSAQDDTGLSAQEQRAVRNALSKKGPVTLQVVVEDFTGSFDNVGEYMDRFLKEFANQRLSDSVKSEPKGVLILLENPTGKTTFRMAVGLEVQERLPVKEPLRAEELNYPEAVRYKNVGPYSKLEKAYRIIEKADRKNPGPWLPVILELINNPKRVKPDQITTDMIVPLVDKRAK